MTRPSYASASTTRAKALAWFQAHYVAARERKSIRVGKNVEPRANLAATGKMLLALHGPSDAADVERADSLAEHAEDLRKLIGKMRRTAGASWIPTSERGKARRAHHVGEALAGRDPGAQYANGSVLREEALFGLLVAADAVVAATPARPKKSGATDKQARVLRTAVALSAWLRHLGHKPTGSALALAAIALGVDEPCQVAADFKARSVKWDAVRGRAKKIGKTNAAR